MSADGLSLSVASLTGDPFINFCLMGCSDVLSKIFLIILVKVFSRQEFGKLLTMSTDIALGLICLTIGITTKFDPEQTITVVGPNTGTRIAEKFRYFARFRKILK